jgi:hypothetical protein
VLNYGAMKLKRAGVLKALKGVKPGRIKRQGHMVLIGTTPYPVKQVYAAATGKNSADFNTSKARKALKKARFSTWKQT